MDPNPHFKRIPRDELPKDMQSAWDHAKELHGQSIGIEVWGNAPHVFNWYHTQFYQNLFYGSALDRKLIELVRLRLANVHGCANCNRADRKGAREAGVPEEQIEGLDDYENGPFSDREKAALALADVMVLTNPMGSITNESYDRASEHLTDGEMLELGVIMAVLCGIAKMIFAYDLVEKEDYCPFIPGTQAAE